MSEPQPLFLCPRCQQLAGRQDRLPIDEGKSVRVIVRCEACRHRWSVVMLAAEARAQNLLR